MPHRDGVFKDWADYRAVKVQQITQSCSGPFKLLKKYKRDATFLDMATATHVGGNILDLVLTRDDDVDVSNSNSGPVDRIRTVYYIHGPKLMKLNFCRFIRVMNDWPYTLL